MALPVPYTAIITPINIYPESSPPALFQVNAPEEIRGLVPAIASAIANELGRKANLNAARTFIYNLVSLNGWQNSNYAELLQFTIDVILVNLKNGYIISIYNEVDNMAKQAITLWSSRKVLQYEELRSAVTYQILSACEENSLTLNNLLQEIQAMYANMGGNQQIQNPPIGTIADTPNGRMVFTVNGWQLAHTQYPQQPYMQQQHGFGQQSLYAPQNPGMFTSQAPQSIPVQQQMDIGSTIGSRYGAAHGTPNREIPFSSTNGVEERKVTPEPKKEEVLTSKNWITSELQPYREMYSKELYDAVYKRVNGVVLEIITPKENIVDREAHRIHSVMGVGLQTVPRMESLSSDVSSLSMVSNIKKDSKVKIPENVSTMICRGWIMDIYIDSLLLEAKIKHLQSGKSIYRCFGNILNPVPSKNKNTEIILEIGEASSFLEIANILTKYVENAGDKDHDYLMYVSQLNKYFTDIVNSFLKNNLSLDGVSIDSFSEDIYILNDYMKKHFGNSYVKSFELFELETVPSIYSNIKEKDIDDSFNTILGTPEGVVFNAVMNSVSVTVVSMTSAELDINVEDTALLISESKSPLLYDIARSLFSQIKSTLYHPLDNYLVTEDGNRFKLYKGYVGMDCYLISKA